MNPFVCWLLFPLEVVCQAEGSLGQSESHKRMGRLSGLALDGKEGPLDRDAGECVHLECAHICAPFFSMSILVNSVFSLLSLSFARGLLFADCLHIG